MDPAWLYQREMKTFLGEMEKERLGDLEKERDVQI